MEPAPEQELAYAGALAALPRMSQPLLRRLLASKGVAACWRAVQGGLATTLLTECGVPPGARRYLGPAAARWTEAMPGDPMQQLALWRGDGIRVALAAELVRGGALATHPRAPAVVFRAGSAPEESAPRVSIVGTRSCTHYGQSVAAELAGALAVRGIEVVSGLEPGIESSAIAGALSGTSPVLRGPCAIVPGGLRGAMAAGGPLLARLLQRGTVWSEAPPDAPGERWRSFRRDVLLALFAEVVVVIEAHPGSGALAVAELAAEAGIAVAAVPGSIRSSASAGTNALLTEGAQLVRGVDDVLGLIELAGGSVASTAAR